MVGVTPAGGDGVAVGCRVAVAVGVALGEGVCVGVVVGEGVLVGLAVAVGEDVGVLVGLAVAVGEGVWVGVADGDGVLVGLAVAVGEDVGVLVGVSVAVDDGVGVADGREVIVGVIAADTSTMASWSARAPGCKAARRPSPQTATTVTARMKMVARWVLLTVPLLVLRTRPGRIILHPGPARQIQPAANVVTSRHCVRVVDELASRRSALPRSQVGNLVRFPATRRADRRRIGRFHWREWWAWDDWKRTA